MVSLKVRSCLPVLQLESESAGHLACMSLFSLSAIYSIYESPNLLSRRDLTGYLGRSVGSKSIDAHFTQHLAKRIRSRHELTSSQEVEILNQFIEEKEKFSNDPNISTYNIDLKPGFEGENIQDNYLRFSRYAYHRWQMILN